MKKTFLAIIAASAAIAASAQYVGTTEVGKAHGWTSHDGTPKMVGIVSYGNPLEIEIYNPDFTVAKKIVLPSVEGNVTSVSGDCFASKYLFNDDDKYEIVTVQGTWDGENNQYTNRVYNEDGLLLGTIPARSVMNVGGTDYLYEYDSQENEYTLWRLEHDSGSLMKITKMEGLRVYPNPVGPGETVRFELPGANGTEVNLYNAAGAHELRTVTTADIIEVSGSELPSGVHPYTVKDGEGNIANGKLIVK